MTLENSPSTNVHWHTNSDRFTRERDRRPSLMPLCGRSRNYPRLGRMNVFADCRESETEAFAARRNRAERIGREVAYNDEARIYPGKLVLRVTTN